MNNPGNQFVETKSNSVSWANVSPKTSLTALYSFVSLDKDNINSAICSHVGTTMTNLDTAWETWDTQYP